MPKRTNTTSNLLREAVVYIHLPGDGYVPAGILRFDGGSGVRTSRSFFRYGRIYLQRPNALPIDPVTIPLTLGDLETETKRGQPLFNALRDASPDRWGRKLLSVMAGVPAETLTEFDILTAAHSDCRIGALAFGENPKDGPKSLAPWCKQDIFAGTMDDLMELAKIVKIVDESDDAEIGELRKTLPDDAFMKALACSFSVGGGRPKALVTEDGADWVTKFSKTGDVWNEPVVEHATMTLAAKCGICVAETRVRNLEGIDVLFVRRFDRVNEDRRHMISGFTLMDLDETGEWGSYQDMAVAARRNGDETAGEEIFRRMVMNILVSNTDDHPKNHAFFVRQNQVVLTPAFDIVPQKITFGSYDLALGVGDFGRAATLENAISAPGRFSVTPHVSLSIVREMLEVARGWRGHFEECGVSGRDIDLLAQRFRQAERAF